MNARPSVPPGLAPRLATFELVRAVLHQKRQLDDAIDAIDASLSTADRSLAVYLAKTVMRRLGEIDALISACLEKPPAAKSRPVLDVLRVGVAQLMFSDVPDHAAVDTTVELCRAAGLTHMAKLVNAVMRRLQRDGRDMLAALDGVRVDTPDWLWQSWCEAYGEDATRAIAVQHLTSPPLDLSVAGDPAEWAARLGGQVMPGGAIRLSDTTDVTALPGFQEGAWWVQDLSARLPAFLMGAGGGRTVADLCAAPGGKTMQLAAAGWRVTALDISKNRLARVHENLARTHLAAEVVCADAAKWRPAEPLDAVLLDAPCSATGTLRRHPDAARLKTPEDVRKLTAVQARLLAAAAGMLKPGGDLVYCTCSLQSEEGPAIVDGFLAANPAFSRRPVRAAELVGLEAAVTSAGDVRTLPSMLSGAGGTDGFYVTRLIREH